MLEGLWGALWGPGEILGDLGGVLAGFRENSWWILGGLGSLKGDLEGISGGLGGT